MKLNILFQVVNQDIEDVIEGGLFLVTSAQYFNETGFLDYVHHTLPEGFTEATESVFKFDGDIQAGRQKLLDAGFVESTNLIGPEETE